MKGLPYTVAEMWKLAELCRYNKHDSGDGDDDLTDYISDHVEARYPDSTFIEMHNVIEYMYILDKPDKLVFTFRGTDGMKAWLNNFKIIPNQLGAHSGFYDLFSYFALEIARYIKNNYDGKKPVYCIGVSLGGAMSQFAYWYLQTRFNITSTCINFGSPVCGNAEFAAEINKCSGLNLRVVNNWDLVTRLDFGIGKHAGSEMQIGTKPAYRRIFPFTIIDHHYYFYTKSLMRYYKAYGIDKMLKPVLKRSKWL